MVQWNRIFCAERCVQCWISSRKSMTVQMQIRCCLSRQPLPINPPQNKEKDLAYRQMDYRENSFHQKMITTALIKQPSKRHSSEDVIVNKKATAFQRPTIKLRTFRMLHLHSNPRSPKMKVTQEHSLLSLTVNLFLSLISEFRFVSTVNI